MEMLNSLKKLFYTRSGEKKKYKVLGLTVVKTDKDSTRKMVNILGIKISKKHKSRTRINARNLKIVKESRLFDYDWYCERYDRIKKLNKLQPDKILPRRGEGRQKIQPLAGTLLVFSSCWNTQSQFTLETRSLVG